MEGVWFLPSTPPIVCWRCPFPLNLQRELVTSRNRPGTVSISDLELAGTVAHKHILTQAGITLAERPIWLGGDNHQASFAWASKGSSTASTARAYLLRLSALHQRHHRYVAQYNYVPCVANVMADDASRRWDLSETALLTHFNSWYPQDASWQLLTLHPDMHSAVIGALSQRRSIPVTLRLEASRPPLPGSFGKISVTASASAPTSKTSPEIRFPSFSFLPSSIEQAESHPATDLFALGRWRTPSARWRRRSPGWGPWTLA